MKQKKTVPKRRKREAKTDYKLRLNLLKSGKTRVVIRKLTNSIIVHFTNYDDNGDKTVAYVHSKSLKKYGWNFNPSNMPSAYLCGFLAGSLASKKGVKEAILDIGLGSSIKGNRIYSALKGVLDTGIKIPHDESILPSEDRLNGKHIAAFAKDQKDKIIFSKSKDVIKINEEFDKIKQKIKDGIGK